MKTNGKRNLIGSVMDKHGAQKYDRDEIVDVFADFYEELYQKRDGEAGYPEMEPQTFTPIDVEEVRGQAKLMANRKSADSRSSG